VNTEEPLKINIADGEWGRELEVVADEDGIYLEGGTIYWEWILRQVYEASKKGWIKAKETKFCVRDLPIGNAEEQVNNLTNVVLRKTNDAFRFTLLEMAKEGNLNDLIVVSVRREKN